jgi:hypothetical protein
LHVGHLATDVTHAVATRNPLPLLSRNALPESPGIPGVAVYTSCVQPFALSPRLAPFLGLVWLIPIRRLELPYV